MALADNITPIQATTPESSPRASALRRLASQLPGAQDRVAQQFQAGQALQLQEAIKAAPSAAPAAAQQIGTQMAQQTGAQTVQGAQQVQQQVGQVGQLATQEQAAQSQKALTGLSEGAAAENLTGRERLARLSDQAAREMYDSRVKFQQDELGRTFWNERQLADYAKLEARSQEELKSYAQKTDQITKDALRIQEAAYRKLEEALQNEQALREQGMNDAQIRELQGLKARAERDIQRKRADAAARSGMFATIGTIAGAVIGGIYTGGAGAPAGAAAGAAIGGGLGTAIGGATSGG